MVKMTDQMNGPSDEGNYVDNMEADATEAAQEQPSEVQENTNQAPDRARVAQIMKSAAFREELQEMVVDQLRAGPHPTSLLALQQITELIVPQAKSSGVATAGKLNGSVMPIADLRGVDSLNYTKGEKLLRNKVAATYRLVDLFGWSHGFSTLVTTRISQDFEHFLVLPYGLLYSEATAANLVKVDMRGDVLDHGSTNLTFNRNGFSLHAAVHQARPDIKSVIHIRSNNAVSISVMNCGLLPVSQEAMALGDISYFDYAGVISDQEEKDKLTRALGSTNKVLFLRNYGVLVGGESTEEAFYLARNVMTACDVQLRAVRFGLDNIALPSDEVRKKAYELSFYTPDREDGGKWKRGELEFEAFMRTLDYAGYRTGYQYSQQILAKGERGEQRDGDMELPPTASSYAYYSPDSKTPMKQHLDKQKKAFKKEWLSTPRSKSTDDAKAQSDDAKELREKFREMRTEYHEERVTAGPQSRVLDGVNDGGAGEPAPKQEHLEAPNSPTKSVSSGEGLAAERSSREGSPTRENTATEPESPEHGDKGDKKKKKFRMPSFASKKKEKK